MTPWSVSPRAGCPNSAARSARASILHAPSSSEYSLWTCRCTPAAVPIGRVHIKVGSGRGRGSAGGRARYLGGCSGGRLEEVTQDSLAGQLDARSGAHDHHLTEGLGAADDCIVGPLDPGERIVS